MNRVRFIAALGLTVLATACGRSNVTYGTSGSIIVAASEELWEETRQSVMGALEPTIFTVRDERAFELTYTAPHAPEWNNLRKWRRILVIGQAEDPWVAPLVARHAGPPPAPPAIFHLENVWARGQEVTVVVLPPDEPAEQMRTILPELHEQIDTRFRQYVMQRMYVSGPDTTLRAQLSQTAGFSLLLPQVYQRISQDSVYLFRNDHPTPGRLERSLLVTWNGHTAEPLTPAEILAWRDSLAARYYDPVQVAQLDQARVREVPGFGSHALEVQGIWSTPPGEWPAAGPFMNRVVTCPDQDRTYFLDAWLYAPREDKYEYMLQLQTILNTFECGDGPAVARR